MKKHLHSTRLLTLLSAILLFTFPKIISAQCLTGSERVVPGQDTMNFFSIQTNFYKTHHADEEFDKTENDNSFLQFKRWEYFWETRVDEHGNFPCPSATYEAWQNYNDQRSADPNSLSISGNWRSAGPFSPLIPDSAAGIGRVSFITFHPTIATTFWVGSPSGGLWKTTDGGVTWTTATDNLPVMAVSDLAVDSINPNVMYLATGDGDRASFLPAQGFTSAGVLKSIDGGITWNTTGINWNVTQAKLIRRILIHPNNHNIILVAASDGIYRSTDAGATFTNVSAGYFIDLAFNPKNRSIVYASTFDLNGNAQVFRSHDNGLTWTQVTSFTGISRIKLGVYKADGKYVDAFCAKTGTGAFAGLYESADSGATFNTLYASGNINLLGRAINGSDTIGQGEQNISYAPSLVNTNNIYAAGINIWKSTDGGLTWNIKAAGFPNNNSVPVVHVDHHFMAFNPLTPTVIYDCDDGGLYKSTDGGNTWINLSAGIVVSEMYRIGISATDTSLTLCGLDDNGVRKRSSGNWSLSHRFDGGACLIDQTNPNNMYISYASAGSVGIATGFINRSNDGFISNNVDISGNIPGGQRAGSFVTPITLNPLNANAIYAGYSDVFKSTDRGNTWTQLSTNLTGGPTFYLRSIIVAPSDTLTIYTAKPQGIYKTINGGTTWTNISAGLPSLPSNSITGIAVKQNDPLTLWVSLGGYTSGTKVYTSSNGGVTWNNFSGTLPNVAINCIVYQNGSNDGLYIGTDLGVYYRDNTLSDWIPFNTGLPNVIVYDLKIQDAAAVLRAATFGRGLWQTDLYNTTGIANIGVNNNTVTAYPNPFSTSCTVQFSRAVKNATLNIYDLFGQKIRTIENISGDKIIIEKEKLNAGIYFYEMNEGSKYSSTGKLMIID